MTATQSLKIYDLLNAQFGQPERARQLTEAIESVIDDKVQEGGKAYATLVHKDLEVIRAEMAKKDDVIKLEQRISDQMKWMIGLFIPLYLSIIGLFVTILLKR